MAPSTNQRGWKKRDLQLKTRFQNLGLGLVPETWLRVESGLGTPKLGLKLALNPLRHRGREPVEIWVQEAGLELKSGGRISVLSAMPNWIFERKRKFQGGNPKDYSDPNGSTIV